METLHTHVFSQSAGWLCLNFANTADGSRHAEWTERLETYDDLLAWAQQSGLLTSDALERLILTAQARPEAAEAALQFAREVRDVIFWVFSAIADAQQPDLTAFNALLAQAFAHQRLIHTAEGYAWAWEEQGQLEHLLWPVIWSAAELLTSPNLERVRECGGPTCSWLFLDTSRNRSRRWCSMESCGNRAKARRHYHRQVKGEAS